MSNRTDKQKRGSVSKGATGGLQAASSNGGGGAGSELGNVVSISEGLDVGLEDVDLEIVSVLDDEGNPTLGPEPDWSQEEAVKLYQYMLLSRVLDERLTKLQRQGRIGFHIWSIGEEAAIIGSAAAMAEQDWIYPCYREAGAVLLRGMTVEGFLHNMFGTSEDPVKGRQMPCHWFYKEGRVPSVSSPIGTQITHAVGTAWAAKIKKDDVAVLTYFGDGATSSNEFHTGLNFGGVSKAPVIFFCRNNQWAISVPFEKQTASGSVAIKAAAYGIRGVRINGNDLLAVYNATREACDRARRGEGPTLIEAVTYRMEGHSTSDDPRVYRDDAEVEPWREKDPLQLANKYLVNKGWWSETEEEATRKEMDAQILAAIEVAENAAPPELESMFEDVYEETPKNLIEQREELLAAPRAPKH